MPKRRTDIRNTINQSLLLSMIESSPLGCILAEPEGNIRYVNKAFLDMFGFVSAEEINSKILNFYELFSDSDRIAALEETQKLLTREELNNLEYTFILATGEPKQFKLSSRAVEDDAANHLYFIHYLEDISPLKRLEAKIEKAREYYKEIFNHTPLETIVVDNMGCVIEYLAADSNGSRTSPIAAGKDLFLGELSSNNADIRHELMNALRSRSIKKFPEYKYKSGYVSIIINPYDDGAIITCSDITQLKNIEKSYRNVIDNSLQGLLILQDGKLVFVNRSYSESSGYKVEELTNITFEEVFTFIHPNDREALQDRLIKRMQGNPVPAKYKCRILSKSGNYKWMELSSTAVEFKGRPAVQVAVIDVDDQTRMEDALRQSEELFRTLYEEAPVAIGIFDSYGTISDCNLACLKTFSVSDKKDLYINIFADKFIPEEQKALLREGELAHFVTKVDFRHYLEEMTVNSGFIGKKHLNYQIIPLELYYEDARVGYIAFISDMTARINHEIEFCELNAELEDKISVSIEKQKVLINELNKEINLRRNAEIDLVETRNKLSASLEQEKQLHEVKSGFINMISHEYRTPLTIILSSTYLIEQYAKTAKIEDLLKQLSRIQSSIKTMTLMVDDVLKFGEYQKSDYKLNINPFDISELIREIIDEINLVKHEGQDIIFDKSEDNLTVTSDKNVIKQIIYNLLLNAIEYSEESSAVKIKLLKEKSSFTIKIIDQGKGISESDQALIFDPFYRGKSELGLSPGSGLGLAVVKRLVQILKGDINLTSKVDEGTSVSVYIPDTSESE